MSGKAMESILASLNEKQRESAVFDPAQALQVVAGPGTGKTKVLTTRVAYLLLEKKIFPGNIIITTFTKKATLEMIERLTRLLDGTGINPNALWIGTFHSICARILRQHGWKVGLPKDWRTFSDSDTDPIVQKLIEKMPDQIRDYAHSYTRKANLLRPNSKGNWEVHSNSVKKLISWLKSQAILVDEYRSQDDHDAALLHFYEQYQAELSSQHALDFDDLLLYAFKLLSQQRCLPHIQHVLVDEFQDTNSIQLDLMYLFARGNSTQSQGITVVGDPDQSIYAFRNALARNFEDMVTKCPIPCSKIVLVENYRSSQTILNTSETLISQQLTGREHRLPLRAQFDCEFPPVYIEFPAKFLEATALAREILYLHCLPDMWSFKDFAILVRHRRQIRPIETALIEHRIPYKIVKGRAFWQLREIDGMMDYLKCVYSNYEKNAILRALQYPARGVGPATVTKIESIFAEFESPFTALKNISENSNNYQFPSKIISVITEFVALIESCRDFCARATDLSILGDVFDRLYEGSGLRYEYLYLDGKKKSEIDPKAEPNELNKRNLNIKVLREHLTNFKPIDEDLSQVEEPSQHNVVAATKLKINIHDILREFINSVNLYSSETEIDEAQMSEKELKRKKEREKAGFVTISTIHGAKGLEWPVVMIPGCVEGVIPCIFGAKDDTDDSDSDSDIDESSGAPSSPKKNKSKKKDPSLDEERRMFFVAQTRAKFLLYLSATNSNSTESRYDSSIPSRFLTKELIGTMTEEQQLFSSKNSIEKLYRHLRKPLPSINGPFSLDVLVKDYEQFINERREKMIWKGIPVFDSARLDTSENTNLTPSKFGITTAAAQLRNNSPHRSPIKSSLSRAPSFNMDNDLGNGRSSNRTVAPAYRPSRITSNCIAPPRKTFAPKVASASHPPSPKAKSFAPKINEVSSKSEANLAPGSAKMSHSLKHPTHDRIPIRLTSPTKPRNNPRPRRKIVADSIQLHDILNESDTQVQTTKTRHNSNIMKEEEDSSLIDTTAAELLHNPRDLHNDNRPILTNAKLLADTIRKPGEKRTSTINSTGRKKMKSEPLSEGFDIMSRLSQAKKRADDAKDTVIIID